MKFMNVFMLTLLLGYSTHISLAYSAEKDQEDLDLLSNIQVSKEDILSSMEMLKKQNKISEADFQKAKKELMDMDTSQLNDLNQKAIGIIKSEKIDPKTSGN